MNLFQVRYAPKVSLKIRGSGVSDKKRIVEGTELRFKCRAEGNPPDMEYRWVLSHNEVVLLRRFWVHVGSNNVALIAGHATSLTKTEARERERERMIDIRLQRGQCQIQDDVCARRSCARYRVRPQNDSPRPFFSFFLLNSYVSLF